MPELVASVVLIDAGRVLLMRSERRGTWVLPGGLVEDGESIAEAAIREAKEETGLEVQLTSLVGVYSRHRWGNGYHVVVFAARVAGGSLQPDPGEVLDACFYHPAELPHTLPTMLRLQIEAAVEGVGGGRVWADDATWPFGPEMTWEAVDELRQQSGLAWPEFMRRHIPDGTITVEVETREPPEA